MDCLIDYVGIRPCGYIASTSGMYIDQLPGIDIAQIDQVANEEQVSYAGLWADLQATSANNFREDILNEFGKRFRLKQVTQSVDLNDSIDAASTTAVQANTKYGILMETVQENSQCACSNLQKLWIQSASFYVVENGVTQVNLRFYDADTTTLIYTKTINGSPIAQGWNTVNIEREFDARRLNIVADGDFTVVATKDISNFFLNTFGQLNNTSYSFNAGFSNPFLWFWFSGCGCQARVQGNYWNSSTNTNNVGTNTYGLSVVFSTKCSFDAVVCRFKRQFAQAWQYRLVIDFLDYRINSPRKNQWTTITKDQAIALKNDYLIKYYGTVDEKNRNVYPGKLRNACESIVLNEADCCLQVNAPYIWRETRM